MLRGMVAENSSVRRSGRRRVEDELEVLAEAEVEHLVGLVEHDGAQLRGVEAAALEMVAQAARRADDDVAAIGQRPLLAAHVHAADAGGDAGARRAIEPDQLALDLQGQLAGRRDDQRQGLAGGIEALGLAEQGRGQGEAVGDGLAGAGLRGDEQVALARLRLQHGRLDGGRLEIAAIG